MTPEPRRIPDALLERYLADSLGAAERARLEASLAGSPQDRARLEELRADSAAFLIQHPPAPLVSRFQQEQRRRRWASWPVLLGNVLTAGTTVLLLLLPHVEPRFAEKGSLILVLHRKAGDGSVPVSPDVPLAPHDSVRFEVKTSASGFVAVLGRDAQGAVFVYYPFDGEAAAPYDVAQQLLPGAIELDDSLGREDVYALHSAEPFELRWAVKALQQGRPLVEAAPPGISVGHGSFVKAARP